MAVNLSDVARLAGVSLATASRVVSNSDYPVSESARERVWQAVDKLNYTPNALARSLATSRSHTIGIVIGSITDPYFAEITAGVEEHGRQKDFLTMVCNGDREIEAEREYLRLLSRHRVDGIVLAGGAYTTSPEYDSYRQDISRTQQNGIRVVAVGPRDVPGIKSITVDDTAMIYDLTREMIALGHREITFMTGGKHHTTSSRRLRGFQMAMGEEGLQPHSVISAGFDFEDGEKAGVKLLEASRPLPDAVVADNDAVALGALSTLRSAGVRIPEDLSIAGADDVRESVLSGLTTMTIPLRKLGFLAALSITSEDADPKPVILPHRVVHRKTTAPSSNVNSRAKTEDRR